MVFFSAFCILNTFSSLHLFSTSISLGFGIGYRNVQCPEATGSVTGVPEQQDGQEKDQGDVPFFLQANKEDATQFKSLPVSTPQALGSEKEQQNQEEQGKSLSNNSLLHILWLFTTFSISSSQFQA